MLLTTVKVTGIAGAAWAVLRSLGLVALGLVVVRWSTVSSGSARLDATPQRAFLLVVVLPLAAVAVAGLYDDVTALLRARKSGKGLHWFRVTSAVVTVTVLLGLLACLLHAPP